MARVRFCMLLKDPSQHSAHTDLFLYLRADADAMHHRLERNLRLLSIPTRERFIVALAKFLGFHRIWEPAVTSIAPIAQIFGHRSRIRYLEADLAALGVPDEVIAATPECDGAAALGCGPEMAAGSLYVMEGSTLGGALIGRALGRQSWVPPQGLLYFTLPGRNVRADWSALHDWAQASWPQAAWPAIAVGARATFDALDSWMSADVSGAPREST